MLPTLILLMAATFWAFTLYDEKIEATKSVRGAVYAQASFGCQNPGSTSFETPPFTTPLPNLEESAEPLGSLEGSDLSIIARRLPTAPGGDVVDRALGRRGATVVRTVAANGLVGGFGTRLTGKTTMPCNESVRDGDAKTMKQLTTSSFDPRSP